MEKITKSQVINAMSDARKGYTLVQVNGAGHQIMTRSGQLISGDLDHMRRLIACEALEHLNPDWIFCSFDGQPTIEAVWAWVQREQSSERQEIRAAARHHAVRMAINVNATGIKEIQEFLAANHRLGGDHFSADMLSAWAQQAEFQQSEGNPASIEITARDSIHGCTVSYDISDEGQSWAEVWEAWEDGKRDEAERFFVPEGEMVDVVVLGAEALGVDVSSRLKVARVQQ